MRSFSKIARCAGQVHPHVHTGEPARTPCRTADRPHGRERDQEPAARAIQATPRAQGQPRGLAQHKGSYSNLAVGMDRKCRRPPYSEGCDPRRASVKFVHASGRVPSPRTRGCSRDDQQADAEDCVVRAHAGLFLGRDGAGPGAISSPRTGGRDAVRPGADRDRRNSPACAGKRGSPVFPPRAINRLPARQRPRRRLGPGRWRRRRASAWTTPAARHRRRGCR